MTVRWRFGCQQTKSVWMLTDEVGLDANRRIFYELLLKYYGIPTNWMDRWSSHKEYNRNPSDNRQQSRCWNVEGVKYIEGIIYNTYRCANDIVSYITHHGKGSMQLFKCDKSNSLQNDAFRLLFAITCKCYYNTFIWTLWTQCLECLKWIEFLLHSVSKYNSFF